MHTSPREPESRNRLVLGLFAGIALLVGIDVAADAAEGADPMHLLLEGLLMGLAVWGSWMFLQRWRRERRRAREALALAQAETDQWRAAAEAWRAEAREALEGLGASMGQQFSRWELAPDEQEVAMLLVRGGSLDELARARGLATADARRLAEIVYRKAGVSSRAELSAFFLDQIPLPGR